MASSPPMPPLVDDPSARPSHPASQQTTPMNQFFDQNGLPPGPTARWQGPGQHWPHQPAPESPLVAGTLSPLSQFHPVWHQPSTSNRPWASPSQTTTTVIPAQTSSSTFVSPRWGGTPFPDARNPIDPVFTPFTQSDGTVPTHPYTWAREWSKGSELSSVSSATSSPDSRNSPGDRALTPFQTLSRHDSVTTISSGFSKSSPVPSNQPEYALATGRPPQQWRADFKMPRTGLSALMHRKKRSIAYPVRHNPKVVISPYLRYSGQDPPVYWDMRTKPTTVLFRDLVKPPREGEFTRFVCEPPAQLMRIYHARMPWYVDVRATNNPVGVTFADLFREIYEVMQVQIIDADFNNDEVDEEERRRITAAYRSRIGSDQPEAMKGIRRVDYLMGKVVFEGLVKGKEGLWEMKTTKPIPL